MGTVLWGWGHREGFCWNGDARGAFEFYKWGALGRDIAGRMGEGPLHSEVGTSTSVGYGEGFSWNVDGKGAFELYKWGSHGEGFYCREDGRGASPFGS